MSNRFPSRVVKDMLNCIDHLNTYTQGISFEEFEADFMIVEACLYNIHIIGEAVAQLDEEVKKKRTRSPLGP